MQRDVRTFESPQRGVNLRRGRDLRCPPGRPKQRGEGYGLENDRWCPQSVFIRNTDLSAARRNFLSLRWICEPSGGGRAEEQTFAANCIKFSQEAQPKDYGLCRRYHAELAHDNRPR